MGSSVLWWSDETGSVTENALSFDPAFPIDCRLYKMASAGPSSGSCLVGPDETGLKATMKASMNALP